MATTAVSQRSEPGRLATFLDGLSLAGAVMARSAVVRANGNQTAC